MKRFIKTIFLSLLILLPSCSAVMPSNYVVLTYSEIITRQADNENLIFYAGTSYCGHCKDYKELLRSYLKSHPEYTLYYLDMEKISETDFNDLFDAMNSFFEANNRNDNLDSYGERYFGTPTTFVYKNGSYITIEMGVQAMTQLDAMFQSIQ